jgi:hypothetical protein
MESVASVHSHLTLLLLSLCVARQGVMVDSMYWGQGAHFLLEGTRDPLQRQAPIDLLPPTRPHLSIVPLT